MVGGLMMFLEVLHACHAPRRLSQRPASSATSPLMSKSPHTSRLLEASLAPSKPLISAFKHLPTNHRTSPEPFLQLFEPSTTLSKLPLALEPSIYLISRSRGFATPTPVPESCCSLSPPHLPQPPLWHPPFKLSSAN
ncbi:hypothetical protein EDD15DRAFT_2378225 [Pisolithus albus]|nr:hypothetical protein EDD15DRAFT_2378225 [Pisolithus albus]